MLWVAGWLDVLKVTGRGHEGYWYEEQLPSKKLGLFQGCHERRWRGLLRLYDVGRISSENPFREGKDSALVSHFAA